jgi:UDP-N-acetylglucosamine--N-acetylmuramyl-(pentapeptide) pyrophosphoryl-undecaprenol N-acetylglucosamine transferase
VGKPTIFIPSPNVAEDHQTKNAMAIVEKKGAIMLKESQLKDSFVTVFENLLQDEQQQQILGSQLKKWAKPKATQEIVDCIEKLILN